MKKIIIILSPIIIVTGIVLFIFMKDNIIRKEMKISFIIAQNHTSKDLAYNGFLNSFEWVILSNEEQKKNWEDAGYIIPFVNFEKNYIIISRYKILKLYQKGSKSECTGVSDGKIIFDKEGSDSNLYYIYLMPNVMLSQGIG